MTASMRPSNSRIPSRSSTRPAEDAEYGSHYKMIAIDTLTNKVIAMVPIGQAAQAVVYVPNTVPEGDGTQGLQPLGISGQAARLRARRQGADQRDALRSRAGAGAGGRRHRSRAEAPLCAGMAACADGGGPLEPLASFTTNPAGAQIVNAVGPIRQVVEGGAEAPRRYLVIAPGSATQAGKPVHVQKE